MTISTVCQSKSSEAHDRCRLEGCECDCHQHNHNKIVAVPIEWVPPNADMIAIARLFLEKFDKLTTEERQSYALLLRYFANPLIQLRSGK